MIKGVGTVHDAAGDRPMMVIGITREDLDQLQAGQPRTFECAPLGLPTLSVIVVFGEGQAEVIAQFPTGLAATDNGHFPGRFGKPPG